MIDEVMQSLELIYTQTFQKVGMSILGDAKSYYVKNSRQCKFSHFLHSHEYFENEFLDFPSLKNNYLQSYKFHIYKLKFIIPLI